MSGYYTALEKINFRFTLGNLHINVINLNRVDPSPDWYVPEHVHSDFEFHIIAGGKGYIAIDDKDFSVKKGELYITGPWIRHKQITDREDPMCEYCLECEITVIEADTSSAFLTDENIYIKETLSKSYPYAFTDIYGISSAFEEVFNEAEEQKPGFLLKIQVLVYKIIIDLFRTVYLNEKLNYKYPVTRDSQDANRIQRLVKYIDANYKNRITMEDVSKILLLSPRQIDRLMKKTFSQTFHDYLLTYRLHTAEKLLMNSSVPIEEVAYESGFSSHFYMYQAFRNRGKQPPGQYRKNS